jgi:predicted transcriptional regulator of viral defense system
MSTASAQLHPSELDRLSVARAVALSLAQLDQPVVTNYQIGLTIFRLYRTGKFQGQSLRTTKQTPNASTYSRIISDLLAVGTLNPHKSFARNSVFTLLGKTEFSAEEVLCSVDPFAYISHLSAMEHHGLTNRTPRVLFYSTPHQRTWRLLATKKIEKDLEADLQLYLDSGLPRLVRIRFSKINGRPVQAHASAHYGAYKITQGKVLRVATIGRTFLDMLRRPDLCGGIHHVLDAFKQSGATYQQLIVDEFDRHGTSIDKVRAGYVLETYCGVEGHPTVEKWLQLVQRGGSRKLDATAEYSPTYSERWCISINV